MSSTYFKDDYYALVCGWVSMVVYALSNSQVCHYLTLTFLAFQTTAIQCCNCWTSHLFLCVYDNNDDNDLIYSEVFIFISNKEKPLKMCALSCTPRILLHDGNGWKISTVEFSMDWFNYITNEQEA